MAVDASLCECCGCRDFEEIVVARQYTADQPLHVCKRCGFVQVLDRREDIAAEWDHLPGSEIYAADDATVDARLTYVARYAKEFLKGSLCDIGCGDGRFLTIAGGGTGITPSVHEAEATRAAGHEAHEGTAEEVAEGLAGEFDTATLLWTLENTASCTAVLKAAKTLLKPGGHLVVATGSRILVPFKKPLNWYLGPNPLDLHSWRFSANTLRHLLLRNGFEPVRTNNYMASEHLVVVARAEERRDILYPRDPYWAVIGYFNRWHKETEKFWD